MKNIGVMKPTTIPVLLNLCLLLVLSSQAVFASDTVGAEGDNIRQLVNDWTGAWRSGNFDAYVHHYIDGFKGDMDSNAAWRKHRRSRVAGRQDINIDIGTVLLRFNVDDPKKAQAVFTQSYRSKSWCDVVEKTLDLRLTKHGWRISEEQSQTRSRC